MSDKSVIHCYGHGGSGWTLAPGTAMEAINDILQQKLSGQWSSLQGQDVTVIGAGIVAQFCVYYLIKLKQKYPAMIGRIQMIADQLEGTASDHAGGLFEPVLIGHSGTDKQLLDSFMTYHDIGLGCHPDFQGVDAELMPSFSYHVSPSTEQLIQRGLIPPPLSLRVTIGNKEHDVTALFYQCPSYAS